MKHGYSYSTFQEFQGTLVFGNFQKFHSSLFERSISNNFTNQFTDEFRVLSLMLQQQDIKLCNAIMSMKELE